MQLLQPESNMVRERMAHMYRAHAGWVSMLIAVALTTSCVTWLLVRKGPPPKILILNGTSVTDLFRVPISKAHLLLKVSESTTERQLTWVEEWPFSKITLDTSNKWITVTENGMYMVFIQVTYDLQKKRNNSIVDLELVVQFAYDEGEQQFCAAYDTRQLTNEEHDAHLSSFFLLNMKRGNRLSVFASPPERVKLEGRPFTTFVSMVRYADFEA